MRRFAQVDVFTARAGLGNPVAVVLDAEGLSDDEMARLANWTNLSETTFVLPPTTGSADYRVRIFTPRHELPMAGHPTIGTCRALLDAGLLPDRQEWLQECGAGLIRVRRGEGDTLSFAAPTPVVSESPVTERMLSRILSGVTPSDPMMIDVGPHWLTGRVSPTELDELQIDGPSFLEALELAVTGINLYAVDDQKQLHLRSFFDGAGVLTEDPVCGSGNAAAAVHLLRTGRDGDLPETYQARQGSHRGRDGRITVTLGDQIWVGGQAVTVISGTINT